MLRRMVGESTSEPLLEVVARERDGEVRREEVLEGMVRRGVARLGPRTPPYPPEEQEQVPPSLPQILDMQEGATSSLAEVDNPDTSLGSPSFLHCVLCTATPPGPPLYGCSSGHIVCAACRRAHGGVEQCPDCGDTELDYRLVVAESLLPTELKGGPRACPHKEGGCNALLGPGQRTRHAASCLFRPVRCPKAMFSSSCVYKGPYCTIQGHGRSAHGLHKGVTDIQLGLITSKMFDKGVSESCCDDTESAKYQPLELVHGDRMFYCYFERVAERRLWLFFVRNYGPEESGSEWSTTIWVGGAGLARGDRHLASHVYRGKVAPYKMRHQEIIKRGLVLAVPDEVLRAGKAATVLFRMWVEVAKVKKEKKEKEERPNPEAKRRRLKVKEVAEINRTEELEVTVEVAEERAVVEEGAVAEEW